MQLGLERRASNGTPDNDKRKKSRALETLTKSALALPGLAGLAPMAHADGPTTEWLTDASYGWYKEADLAASKWDSSRGGSRERFSIHAFQLGVVAPVTNQIDASVDFVFETMSGASPWYVVQDSTPGGDPLQVMTGATIEDTRIDGQVAVNHYFDRARLSLSGGFSTENDYLSGNFGFSGERSYNDKNTILGLGVSFSWDTITPTDPTEHRHLPGAQYDKKTVTVSGNITQLLSKSAMLQIGATFKNNQGYLSDPYKEVWFTVVDQRRSDARPDLRNQGTFLVRYRQFVEPADASLHLDVQGYLDSWGVRSLAVETAWYQALGDTWHLVPSFRYYSQSQADFYQPYFFNSQLDSGLSQSSDYRLAPFGSLQVGIQAKAKIQGWPRWATWHVSAGYDYYFSDSHFAMRKVDVENPGLVNWGLLSAQLGGRF